MWAPALFALAVACGSTSADEAPAPAPHVAPTPAPAPAPAASPTPVAPSASTRRADERRADRAVSRARRLDARGDHTAALVAFEEALRLTPSARLRCETGYVAFRAGETARANELIEQALGVLLSAEHVPEPLRVPTAMCLYNAGLVRTAAGRIDDARAAYTRSLALRPNATVEAHLAALGPAADDAWQSLPATTTSDELTALLGVEAHCDGEDEECSVETVVADPAIGIEAAIITFVHPSESFGSPIAAYLSVRLGARRITRLLAQYSGETDGDAFVLRGEDVVPGGPLELVVEATVREYDEDWESFGDSTHHWTFVCRAGDEPACVWLTPTATNAWGPSAQATFRAEDAEAEEATCIAECPAACAEECAGCVDDENENDGACDDCAGDCTDGCRTDCARDDEPIDEGSSGWSSTLRFEGGRAIFDDVHGEPGAATTDVDVHALFGRRGARWPDDWDPSGG